jgi:thiol:disulfide interchange protein DsbD
MRFISALIVLGLFVVPAWGAADLVQARMFADVTAIQPGKPFTLGVLLTIKPGWHVYWKNPGDAGLPTRVKFTLPDGFTAGELRFPTPVRMTDPGNIVSFGYHNEVLLTAMIAPPASLKSGDPIAMTAKVDWLCSWPGEFENGSASG